MFHRVKHQIYTGADLFHADGEQDGRTDRKTDMTKLVVAFRNFENAPNVRNGLFAILHGALNIHLRKPRTWQRNQLLY
jgi:Fe-S-cluster formation regulator IscX/YfhJ